MYGVPTSLGITFSDYAQGYVDQSNGRMPKMWVFICEVGEL